MMRANFYRYELGAGAAFMIPIQQHWLRFDYEYRYPLSELSQVSGASHLLLLSYVLSRPRYDFELVAEATSQSIYPGEQARYRIGVKRIGNFNDPVRVKIGEMPSYLEYSIVPLHHNDDQGLMLTITPSYQCPPGDYPIQLIAQSREKQKQLPIHLTVKKRPALGADVLASVDKLIIRETTRIFSRDPLLPYIFFDEGSAVLSPKRYEILNPEQHRMTKFVFSPERLLDILTKYRNTLNVIAKRLWDHPEMEIIVRGYNSDWGIEKGDLELSRRRAEAVRDYLVKNCGVNPRQIKIEAYGLPPDPASNLDPRGREENQRVEITCPPNSQPILDPIVTETSEIASSHDQCEFYIQNLVAESGLKRWELVILTEPQDTFKVFAGKNPVHDQIVWDWKNDLGQSVSIGKSYRYQLRLWDQFGQEFATSPKEIRVERISEVAREYIQKNIEKTRLILFKYDRADMDLSQKSLRDELELNAGKLRSNSVATLLIQGHTDVIGDPDYNMRLSLRRSETVARYFMDQGISKTRMTYQGFGMNKPLIDNDLPEGRMMNRRVEIFILY
ncbi:MAG: OmpA family protein, partial [candidate division KSB1 bacterium]|nr:OmpA family protein [candidate division KSB1 bacterium]